MLYFHQQNGNVDPLIYRFLHEYENLLRFTQFSLLTGTWQRDSYSYEESCLTPHIVNAFGGQFLPLRLSKLFLKRSRCSPYRLQRGVNAPPIFLLARSRCFLCRLQRGADALHMVFSPESMLSESFIARSRCSPYGFQHRVDAPCIVYRAVSMLPVPFIAQSRRSLYGRLSRGVDAFHTVFSTESMLPVSFTARCRCSPYHLQCGIDAPRILYSAQLMLPVSFIAQRRS